MSQDRQNKALRVSYPISLGIALAAALGFFIATSAAGHSLLTRYGGSLWVLLLSLIIALPTLTPLVKRRYLPMFRG